MMLAVVVVVQPAWLRPVCRPVSAAATNATANDDDAENGNVVMGERREDSVRDGRWERSHLWLNLLSFLQLESRLIRTD